MNTDMIETVSSGKEVITIPINNTYHNRIEENSDLNSSTPENSNATNLQNDLNPDDIAKETNQTDSNKLTEDDLLVKYNEIARYQQKLDSEMQKLKQQRQENKRNAKIIQMLKEDPMQAFNEMGINAEDVLLQSIPREEKPKSEYDILMEKVKSLEEKLENEKKSKVDQEQKEIQKTFNNYINHIKEYVASSDEQYQFIQANNAEPHVFNLIREVYQQTGEQLPLDKACQEIESYYEENYRKLAKLSKFNKLVTPSEPENKIIESTEKQVNDNVISYKDTFMNEDKEREEAIRLLRTLRANKR